MKTEIKVIVSALALALMGAGCVQFSGTSGSDGGVWVTSDKGEHWKQSNGVLSVGGAKTLNAANVTAFAADPQDPMTVYIATAGSGLLYTTDGGASWSQPRDLGSATIAGIAPDPKNKCVVYAITGNIVAKTSDCTRTWSQTYEETRAGVTLNSIAIDHFNPQNVYLSTTKNDILKSTDGGMTWSMNRVFPSQALKVAIDPFDSRVVYAGTKNDGIWKTTDGGANWTDLTKGLDQFSGAKTFYNLVPDASKRDSWVLVSQYGLVRTKDGGTTWEKVPLVTGPGQARIYAFAMNPANGDEMYYSTATVFYKSTNGGKNWSTKRLPTSRVGDALMVSGADANKIYLGTLVIKK